MTGLPDTMQVAVYKKPRVLEIEERAVPALEPDEVLLEISHCGICGSDLHLVLEGMGRPGSVGGHEYSGRIVATGVGVSEWKLGDEVVGAGAPSCGTCAYCTAGRPSLCTARAEYGGGESLGAFAGYKKLHSNELIRIPAGVGIREAALAEPLAVAMHAVTVGAAAVGQRVLVTGAGPIGLLIIAVLAARGVEDITVSEPSEVRRAAAARVGARTLTLPEELDSPPMPFSVVDEPFDLALECSGNPRAMQSALGQLRRMGKLVLVGAGMHRPKFDHNRILMNELVVTGAYCYDANGFENALELLASGTLPTEHLIEPTDVPLVDLFGALEALERQELAGKVMIVPRT
jgi:2-desacetyl-2-hydroxyethyl bacteriochlorophyllide A dehydrogenase